MNSKKMAQKIVIGLCALAIGGAVKATDIQAWWYERGLVNTQLVANDFAPANVGQLKNVAYQTWVEVTNQLTQIKTNGIYVPKSGGVIVGDLTVKSNLMVGTGSATGLYAVAEGEVTTAYGKASHAEGSYTKTSGDYSHAEGNNTKASGINSHAEGLSTEAAGAQSHAAGHYAQALHDNTYVWSDGSFPDSVAVSSTTQQEYTVYAQNGIRLLGGVISGNGAGLTNLTLQEQDPVWNSSTGAVYEAIALKQDAVTAATDTELEAASNALANTDAQLTTNVASLSNSLGQLSVALENLNAALGTLGLNVDSISNNLNMAQAAINNLQTALSDNYLTTASSDARYINATGDDTLAGNLRVQSGLVVGDGTASGTYAVAEGDHTVIASGNSSHAGGQNAKAIHNYTQVWSDGANISSTAGQQYTVYARNGIRLLGGQISGDGSGLSGVVVGDSTITSAKIANGTITSDDIGTLGSCLNFVSSLGDKISLYADYGLGIQNSLLQIHSSYSGSDIAFGYGPSASMTETMRIKGNGNVGIGTTSPQKLLHIQGASSAPLINDGQDRPGIAITGYYPEFTLFSRVGNATCGPTIRLGSYNNASSGNETKQWVIGTSGYNSHFLDFGFSANNNGSPHNGIRNQSGTTVLTLTENGNVGIGTTSPAAKLDVNGKVLLGVGPECRNYFKDLELSTGTGLRVGAAWGMYGIYAENGVGVMGGVSGASIQNNSMFVSTAGNVGIGTTSPGAKLDVKGSVKISGDLEINTSGTGQLMNANMPMFACRVWVNFDGTTGSTIDGEFRCTIRGCGNVSKVVRQGTGDYVIHFITAMPDANYCKLVQMGFDGIASYHPMGGQRADTTSSCSVAGYRTNTGYVNNPQVFVAIIR